LPEGFAFLHTPADFTITHPCFSLQGRSTVAGSTGTFSFKLRRTCSEIAVDDYSAFRDRMRDASAKLRDVVSFVPKKRAIVRSPRQ
jgi:hypothetical protein